MVIRVTSLSKLSALLLLLEKPRHGYELIKDIREKFNYNVSAGQVYPFLSSLVKLKFLIVEKRGARDKKVYCLTAGGRQFAKRIVDNFEELVELAIAKKVHACSHCGCKVLGKGYCERVNGKKLYFCCASCASTFN